MEMEDPIYGLPVMILLLTLGTFWTPLHHSTPSPVHLPSPHRSLFGGESRAKDLKQALLGRQPKPFYRFLSTQKKEKK